MAGYNFCPQKYCGCNTTLENTPLPFGGEK